MGTQMFMYIKTQWHILYGFVLGLCFQEYNIYQADYQQSTKRSSELLSSDFSEWIVYVMKSSCHNSFQLYSHGISAGSHTQQLQTITYRCREKRRILRPLSYKHNMKSSGEFIHYRDTPQCNIMDFILMSAWQEKYFLSYFNAPDYARLLSLKDYLSIKQRPVLSQSHSKVSSLQKWGFIIEHRQKILLLVTNAVQLVWNQNGTITYEKKTCLCTIAEKQKTPPWTGWK